MIVKKIRQVSKATGGRPSRAEARRLPDKIMDAAAHLFFTEGYGTTSIEAIARRARISKRTFYHRYAGKPEIFKAVVHRLIRQMRPGQVKPLFEGKSLEDILLNLSRVIVQAALTPYGLALHRTILAEAVRFPELALIMDEEGARREAVHYISALLQKEAPEQTVDKNNFLAEQFLQMITSLPQRRALGLGKPMSAPEIELFIQRTVRLFLQGWRG